MILKNNILGIRGRLGNLVFKKYRYGTVVSRMPDMSKAGCSDAQRQQRLRFQQAITKVKEALRNPDQKAFFEKMRGKGSAWNKAVRYYMNLEKEGEKLKS
jgi:hypothetical protein